MKMPWQYRRYDRWGRLLHTPLPARPDREALSKRWVEPVLAPLPATNRLAALEGWLEYTQ